MTRQKIIRDKNIYPPDYMRVRTLVFPKNHFNNFFVVCSASGGGKRESWIQASYLPSCFVPSTIIDLKEDFKDHEEQKSYHAALVVKCQKLINGGGDDAKKKEE